MVNLTISIQDIPTEFKGMTGLRPALQTKKDYMLSSTGVFSVQLDRAKNRKGEEQWVGDAVHFHGDGRRFIYLTWFAGMGHSFGRIKLYLDQIPGLNPESGQASVTISGTGKRGGPAFATANVIQ